MFLQIWERKNVIVSREISDCSWNHKVYQIPVYITMVEYFSIMFLQIWERKNVIVSREISRL